MSDLELIVYKILRKAGKKFEQEKQFKDIYNGLYRYDFYLPDDKILIEVQGIQHYQYTKIFHKNLSEFKKAQERDRRKVRGAAAKHLSLYCIPYWEIENLNSFSDLTAEKFLAKSQFHNDIVWREHQKLK